MAEGVEPDLACPVDQDQTGCAAKVVARHGDRHTAGLIMGVDPDRKPDPVFVQECFQGNRRHRVMVFEDGMQPQHRHVLSKGTGDPLGLGKTVADTPWAQHLERFDRDYLAGKVVEADRCVGVEPSGNCERWSWLEAGLRVHLPTLGRKPM